MLTLNPEPGAVGHLLWNPSTGAHYEQYEPRIPLISVGSVIDDSNVSRLKFCNGLYINH